ncbi:MAG: hypothetical protein J6M59_09260 [Bacteroidaceae bacterium]|nr:hypothetical protein [Bacteroidaceae bacterium]
MKKCFLLILLFCALVVNARNECGMENNDSLCKQLIFPVLVNGNFASYKLYYKENGKYVEVVDEESEYGFVWNLRSDVYYKLKNADSIRVEVYTLSKGWGDESVRIRITKPSSYIFKKWPNLLYIFLADNKCNRKRFKLKNKRYNYAVRWLCGSFFDMNP